MGSTYVIEDTGETEWAWKSKTAFNTAAGAGVFPIFGAPTAAALAGANYRKYNKFTISFKGENGEVVTKTGIYGQKPVENWDTGDTATTAEQSVLSSPSGDETENNHLRFWELSKDDRGWWVKEDDEDKLEPYWAMRGGMATEEPVEDEAAALHEEIERDPHATLYVASMNVSINSETGLINEGAFKLRWNDLEKVPLWNSGVRSKYIAIQKGEVEDNSVALMKEQVWLPPVWDFKTYNSYADLNTGKYQQSPTLTRVPTDPPTFRVNYGNSNAPVGEEKGLKNKYKRFRGSTYTTGMALAIDDIVKVAMKGMRPKSEFNFKQVDTNTRFKKEFLSLFNRVPTTTETIDTTTSATTMMSR